MWRRRLRCCCFSEVFDGQVLGFVIGWIFIDVGLCYMCDICDYLNVVLED